MRFSVLGPLEVDQDGRQVAVGGGRQRALLALLLMHAGEVALGRHAALVPELEVLAARHPERERVVGQLMLALYRSGRQAEALAAYRAARRALVEELGLEPGRDLRRLEAAVLAQDSALDLPRAASAPSPASSRARPRRRG